MFERSIHPDEPRLQFQELIKWDRHLAESAQNTLTLVSDAATIPEPISHLLDVMLTTTAQPPEPNRRPSLTTHLGRGRQHKLPNHPADRPHDHQTTTRIHQ